MFDIISKKEYWQWLDDGVLPANGKELKHVQDAFILSQIPPERARILEVGAGKSRILERLKTTHECWSIDGFEGKGNGPKGVRKIDGVTTVVGYMGEFKAELPSDYFDYVVSVSVVEHIANSDLKAAFQDCARVLKPKGKMLHAIDLYVFDDDYNGERQQHQRNRVNLYLQLYDGLEFIEAPRIGPDVHFRCKYASNQDTTMHQWNRSVPSLASMRAFAQSVSIKAGWIRTG